MVKLSLKQFRAGSNMNDPDNVLQNMVKLILNQDQTGKIMLVIA